MRGGIGPYCRTCYNQIGDKAITHQFLTHGIGIPVAAIVQWAINIFQEQIAFVGFGMTDETECFHLQKAKDREFTNKSKPA